MASCQQACVLGGGGVGKTWGVVELQSQAARGGRCDQGCRTNICNQQFENNAKKGMAVLSEGAVQP